jgi:hypothetical protein
MSAGSALLWIGSAVVTLAALLGFYRSGRSLAEAGAFALAATILAAAVGIQLNRATGLAWPAILTQTAAAATGAAFIWRQRDSLAPIGTGVLAFARTYPLPLMASAAAWASRGLTSAMGLPMRAGPLLTKEMLLKKESAAAMTGSLAAAGWIEGNKDLLVFMAYGMIGLTTYALSRRHAWPPTAATAALLVVSMPRLSHPQPATTHEIVAAALAVMVLLTVYRLLEQPRIDDLLAMVVGIGLLWSGQPLGWVLPAVLTALAVMMLYRRHGLAHLVHLAGAHRWWVLGSIVLVAVLSPAWTGCHALFFQAEPMRWENNPHGIAGAVDHAARALLAAANLGLPQQAFLRSFGLWWQGLAEAVYSAGVAPLTGPPGTAAFGLSGCYGFGPFALLLVVPAIGYSLAVGPRRLKALALALTGYFYLIMLIAAWSAETIRLVTPLMVLSGATMAFFLPPWRLTRWGRRCLQSICLLLLLFGMMP